VRPDQPSTKNRHRAVFDALRLALFAVGNDGSRSAREAVRRSACFGNQHGDASVGRQQYREGESAVGLCLQRKSNSC
jgi:hypothetical protein